MTNVEVISVFIIFADITAAATVAVTDAAAATAVADCW